MPATERTPYVIQTADLAKEYVMGTEHIHALRSVSIDIKRGEYVAFMGPSGSGKSTLMNIVGCLDTPSKGQYILNGQDVSRMSDNQLAEVRNKEIGFVFQTFNLLPRSTSLENVALPLIYAGLGKRERTERALEALRSVGLADRAGHRPNELSGGQRQRVAIARAIYKDAPILILDEATSALDTEAERAVQAALEHLMQGKTTLVIAHRLSTIERADRIVVLSHGKIMETGSHQQLLDANGAYANLHRLQFSQQVA